MQRIYLRLLLLFAVACGSNSKVDVPLMNPAQSIEIEAVFAYAPRRAQELEAAILNHPKVQACLKLDPEIRSEKFVTGAEGYLSYKGLIEGLSIAATEPLKACLTKEIGALALGRGRAGPFKMQVGRVANPGQNPKAILLVLLP
jgi:hypothetical protein